MVLPGTSLIERDFEKLAATGISRDLAERALLRRVASLEGAELIGRNGSGDYSGVVFPYIWPGDFMRANEPRVREYLLRCDHPEVERAPDGTFRERNKYLFPP